MELLDMLDELQKKALKDETLKRRFLETEKETESLEAFCKVCQQEGYPVHEMDLLCAGEEMYASMKRSTNGGGENSPMLDWQDDYYELFLASIK